MDALLYACNQNREKKLFIDNSFSSDLVLLYVPYAKICFYSNMIFQIILNLALSATSSTACKVRINLIKIIF